MTLTDAEQQLIEIIRAAQKRDITITIRVREGRYAVRIATG